MTLQHRGPATPTPEVLAPLRRRLAAALYEILLLAALLVVVGFALLPVTSPAAGAGLPTPSGAARAISFWATFFALAGYAAYFWTHGRRTLPMKTWHLRIMRADGTALSAGTALLRYVAGWIGPGLALIAYLALRNGGHARQALWLLAFNFLWAFVDRKRLFLHDRLARTRIVVAS